MKRSKLLFVAAVIGSLYLVFLISHFYGLMISPDSQEAVGATLATALVTPHMLCVGLAVIFNWLGFAMKLRWSALVAGIMYAVSILCMFIYAMFVVIEMILCFIAYAKMKPDTSK